MTNENKKELKTKIAHKIILRPLITEKMAIEAAKNKYGFLVNRTATKKEVMRAMEEIYKVKPVKVNTINVQGKTVRRGKTSGKRSDVKKAIVTLASGQTITHEGV
ncbi:MAG: 50S ribosomal protein L23 [Candidatus Magasanikbacteria bacterium]|nr:50S ribosomal protein L23 [Candidatus Magasanikbacteria bacterium]